MSIISQIAAVLTHLQLGGILPSRAGTRHLGHVSRHEKQMMIPELTKTEAQSDPDSSILPIACAKSMLTQTVGHLSIRQTKRGANRPYPAHNGAVPLQSVRVYADSIAIKAKLRRHRWAGNWFYLLVTTAALH